MFLAMLLVCTSAELSSCDIYYNTEKVFLTEAECEADLEKAVNVVMQQPITYIKTACTPLPGESA